MLAGPVAAHDPPVLHVPDVSDRGDIVAHGIADGDPLDLVKRAEAGEIGNAKLLCTLPRNFKFPGFRGKPHRGGAVIDPDKHSSNPIAWMTYAGFPFWINVPVFRSCPYPS